MGWLVGCPHTAASHLGAAAVSIYETLSFFRTVRFYVTIAL